MTAQTIDGKAIAREIRVGVARRVRELEPSGLKPGLAAVLVGDNPASMAYVGSKEKFAGRVGFHSVVRRLPATTSQDELIGVLDELNRDNLIDGILLQLPLPKGLDGDAAVRAIDPAKDVDGLHSENAGLLTLGRPRFVPCTPLGVQVLLDRSGIKVEGAHVVVVGRSNLVGRPLSILLSLKAEAANATVTLCHTGTVNLAEYTRRADILVAAAGIRQGITGDMIKPGAVVIDVGIERGEDGNLVGDVDFHSASEVASAITPVPGGVGPMTVAMLLSNTLRAAELRRG